MKNKYSHLFKHYYGLKFDNNIDDIIKVHQLMEDAGIVLKGLTKVKIDAYSDRRSFKVNYFISKVGHTLKWCPTASPGKLSKMTLFPAEWWIKHLTGSSETEKSTVTTKIPENWLDVQLKQHINTLTSTHVSSGHSLNTAPETTYNEEPVAYYTAEIEYEELPETYDSAEEPYDTELPF
jgi:hypothetical protein